MLWFPVMLLLVGLVAGAVGREVAAQPHPLGDAGPWTFALAGSAIGAVVGLVIAGGDTDQDADQWSALLLSIVGAAIGVAAFVAMARRGQRAVETNQRTRQRSTPVPSARDSETGRTHGS